MFNKFWKSNGSFIIFFLILAFAGGSFYLASVQGTKNAKELIAFADGSVPEIRGRLKKIQNLTTGIEATNENYDALINEISGLSDKSLSMSLSVPDKNSDEDSKALSDGLKAFLLKVKTDTSDPLLSRFKLEKELLPDIVQYVKVRDLSANGGSISEAKKTLTSGETILAKNIEYQKTIKNETSASSAKKENEDLETKVKGIKEIFGNFSGDEVTAEQKAALVKLYNNSYPNQKKFVSIIQPETLEPETFAKDISSLQQSLFKVKSRYSL